MKILITYHSLSGNTEKVAAAMREALATGHETALKKMEDAGPADLEGLSLLFAGFPCHANNISAAAADFFKKMSFPAGLPCAGFVTHAAPEDSPRDYGAALTAFENACRSAGLTSLGAFNCRGRPAPGIADYIKKEKNFADDVFERELAEMMRHPDESDLARARVFALSVAAEESTNQSPYTLKS